MKNISPLMYEQNRVYNTNDVIIHNQKLYVVKEQFTAVDFDTDIPKLQEQGSKPDFTEINAKLDTKLDTTVLQNVNQIQVIPEAQYQDTTESILFFLY